MEYVTLQMFICCSILQISSNTVAVDVLQKLTFPDGLHTHEKCAEYFSGISVNISEVTQLCTKVWKCPLQLPGVISLEINF